MSKKRGNGEGSISYRKDRKLWEGRISVRDPVTGKRKRRTVYGKTRKEVADKVSALLHQQHTGMLTEPTKMTVSEFMDHWLQTAAKSQVRSSTYVRYECLARIHVSPALGSIRLQGLQPLHIQNLYAVKLLSGLAPNTVRQLHAVLTRLSPKL